MLEGLFKAKRPTTEYIPRKGTEDTPFTKPSTFAGGRNTNISKARDDGWRERWLQTEFVNICGEREARRWLLTARSQQAVVTFPKGKVGGQS